MQIKMTEAKKARAKRLLRAVRRKILRNPRCYDQAEWCGTAGCIAYHLVRADDPTLKLKKSPDCNCCYVLSNGKETLEGSDVASRATKLLGRRTMPWLFMNDLGLSTIRLWQGDRATAKQGAAAINRYIKENLS